ncbi:MAG: penicillin acylase family protein [Rhizobiaceae bacterium]
MRVIFKWSARIALLLVAGVMLLAAIGYSAITSSIPASNGSLEMAGLGGDVRVVRDRHGIPHIEATSRIDALRALGFVHAQDRLWQMHVLRMVGQGRLSEMFGKPTIATDVFLRTMDIAGASSKSISAFSEEAQALLQAYSDGINAYLNRRTRMLEMRLPPEFVILGVEPEPWQPWHTVSLLKVMALTLDDNMDREIRRLAFAARGFSPKEIDELLPYGPRDNPPPLPDLRQLFPLEGRNQAALDNATGEVAGLVWDNDVNASNNWVVSGSRTTSGSPLLANDPHLGLTTPAVFYLAHLAYQEEGEVRNLIGGTLPGTPLFLLGRNDNVAWGLTTTVLDAQDLYVERLKPDDPNQYLTPNGWAEFKRDSVSIKVKGEPDFTFERRMTRHGPVLPDAYRSISEILPLGHVAALKWMSLAEDDTTVEAALDIAKTRSVQDYFKVMRKAVAPMQSMVVADKAGHIGVIAPARVPVRDPGNQMAGRAPVPGWMTLYDWKGTLAFEDLPMVSDPQSGALATANANWLPAGYGGHITFDWDEHFRQARVEQLVIGRNEKHSPDTMRSIQADKFSPAMTQFRDEALAQIEEGAGQDPAMLEALRAWDGEMLAGTPEPLMMTAWWRNFHKMLFEDDLKKDYQRIDKGYVVSMLAVLRGSTSRDWCNRIDTPQAESCGTLLSLSWSAAVSELQELQGKDWRKWQWGKAHIAFGEHRPFSSVGALANLFTVTRESAGGSYTLLRGRTDFGEDHPYRNVHSSAYRGWYDLGELDSSQFIISTGQSGHFLSPHYDDLADLWAQSEYVSMNTSREAYEEGADGAWMLHPQAAK